MPGALEGGRRLKNEGSCKRVRGLDEGQITDSKEEIVWYFAQKWTVATATRNPNKLSKNNFWYWFAIGNAKFLTKFLKRRRN